MKIYLAARYSRRVELLEYRRDLESLGHVVTSRWLDGSHQLYQGQRIGDFVEKAVEEHDEAALDLLQHFASEDFHDVYTSDAMICFTEPPRSDASRGGRHVEAGIGMSLGKRMIVVGHRENLFYFLPTVEFCKTWDEAYSKIGIIR